MKIRTSLEKETRIMWIQIDKNLKNSAGEKTIVLNEEFKKWR